MSTPTDNDRGRHFRPPAKLYKYLPETAFNIFDEYEIKCTPHGEFDDLFDSFHIAEESVAGTLNVVGAPYYFMEVPGFPMKMPGYDDPPRRQFREWLELSANKYPGFSIDYIVPVEPFRNVQAAREFAADFWQKYTKQFRDPLLLCLTADYKNRIMWERYSNAFKGFCVGFHSDARFLNSGAREDLLVDSLSASQTLRLVQYSLEPSTGPREVAIWRRWLVKHKEYEYEKEWRVQYPPKLTRAKTLRDGRRIRVVHFEHHDISQIVFGARADDKLIDEVKSRLKGTVDLFRLQPDFSDFSVRPL